MYWYVQALSSTPPFREYFRSLHRLSSGTGASRSAVCNIDELPERALIQRRNRMQKLVIASPNPQAVPWTTRFLCVVHREERVHSDRNDDDD